MERKNLNFPNRFESREYKIFKKEEHEGSIPRTFYEKACRLSHKILKIDPGSLKKVNEAIEFTHLNVTPGGVASLTMLAAFLICFPTFLITAYYSLILKTNVFGYALLVMLLALPLIFLLYYYPLKLKRQYEISSGSEIVLAVLYMSIFMRNTPNLEGALRFASENLSGSLSYELRKLLWDLEIGNYLSAEDAMMSYSKKWSKNKEFVEAVEVMISSLRQPGERRIEMLDEAIKVIMEGNRENARHFNQRLKMPVMVVHALGIILPILGLVLFPLVAIFLEVDSTALFIGYDIILPLVLYFVISSILDIRPATFSKIDITDNPDIPPKGKFFYGKKPLPIAPFAIIPGIAIVALGIVLLPLDKEGILPSMVILSSIPITISIYLFLSSRQKMRIREQTRAVEDEFAESMFQLGNQIYSGIPIEISIEKSMRRINNLKIKDLYATALRNMRTFGMTFSQAFFDKDSGAIKNYPSRLIKSVIKSVVESSKKGVKTASITMLSISNYLKGLHQTQEDVKEQLNETVSSMKFQAYFLSPLISGIITTMAIVIIRILLQLHDKTALAGIASTISFFNEIKITPFEFIVIVGVYVIETSIILSIFINGIENGEDPIGRNHTLSVCMLIAFIVFVATTFLSLMIFGPLTSVVV